MGNPENEKLKERDEKLSLTSELDKGTQRRSFLALQQGGVLPEQFATIGADPYLASTVSGAILQHTLFSNPKEQIERTLLINEHVWKDSNITEKILCKELGEPPICPPPVFTETEKRFYCLVLFCEMKDKESGGFRENYIDSFWRYFKAAEYCLGPEKIELWGEYESQGKQYGREKRTEHTGVILRDDAWHTNHKDFYWLVVELGYRFIRTPYDEIFKTLNESKVITLGHQVFAIPAMHPKWAQAMMDQDPLKMGDDYPFGLKPFAIPDLLILDSSGRSRMPHLAGLRGTMRFQHLSGGGPKSNYSPAYIVNQVNGMSYSPSTDLI